MKKISASIRPPEINALSAADTAILERTVGWSEDRLFKWANSKDGRMFGDLAIGCEDLPMALRHVAIR